MNRYFTKKGYLCVQEAYKKHSISLVVKENQNKTTMSYYYTLNRIEHFKALIIIKGQQAYGANEILTDCWCKYKLVYPQVCSLIEMHT